MYPDGRITSTLLLSGKMWLLLFRVAELLCNTLLSCLGPTVEANNRPLHPPNNATPPINTANSLGEYLLFGGVIKGRKDPSPFKQDLPRVT